VNQTSYPCSAPNNGSTLWRPQQALEEEADTAAGFAAAERIARAARAAASDEAAAEAVRRILEDILT
jgi:hypothetical protein